MSMRFLLALLSPRASSNCKEQLGPPKRSKSTGVLAELSTIYGGFYCWHVFFTFDNVALQLLVCFLNPYRLTVDLVGQAQVRSSCFFWRHAALNRGILERAAPEPTGGRWEAGPRSFQFRSYATLFRKMDNRSQGLQFCSWWSMERADGSPPLS